MKKILFLLLITISGYAQTLQNPTYGTVAIKNNVKQNDATRVMVQDSITGESNWILKSSIVTPDATTILKGKVKLAGDLSGTADLPTVPALLTKVPYASDNKISPTKIKAFRGNTGQILNPNILSGTTYTDGFFVNFTNGGLSANAIYTSTDFIDIKPNTKYKYFQATNEGTTIFCAFYDAGNVYISGLNQNIATSRNFITPANAKKIRITYKGVGTDAPQNFFLYKSLKMTSYGDSTTAQNMWQPTLTENLGLTSFVNGFAGYKLSGNTISLNQDTYLLTIPSDSDIITLLAGINDWANNVPLGATNSQNISEFYGALNVTFGKLKTNYPNAVVIALATTYAEYPGRVGFTDPLGITNTQGLTTVDYGEAVITAAKNNNVRFVNTLNLWDHQNITNFVNFDFAYLHPNSAGGKEMADKISLDMVQDVLSLKQNKLTDRVEVLESAGYALDANVIHTTGNETKVGILTLQNTAAGALKVDRLGSNNSTINFTSSNVNANSYTIGFDTDNGFFGVVPTGTAMTSSPARITASNGNFRTSGTITTTTVPTTSGGTYDFKTRNATTGVEEKIPSANVATSASVLLKEDTANKQNSLATDVTNTKFPTVTAVNTGLALKENAIIGTTTVDYYRGDKTFQPLNSAVIGSVLAGYTSGAGTVSSSDNILQAIQKLNGNDAVKAPLQDKYTTQNVATYTLVLNDGFSTINNIYTTASSVYTIPLNSSVAFPLGTKITIIQSSTSFGFSVTPSGGVTLISPNGLASRWGSTMVLTKVLVDTWHVDISTPGLSIIGGNTLSSTNPIQCASFSNPSGTASQILLANGTVGIQPKKYNALITQTATGDPTVALLENTLAAGAIVWTRTTTGSYVGTLSGAFPATKTLCFINNTVFGSITLQQASANTVTLTTADLTGTLLDGRLTANSLRIEVYP